MKEMPAIDSTTEAEAATTLESEDKYEVKSAPVAGQPQTEDETKQGNASDDSLILVENVASEIEERNKDLKGSNAELRFSEETVEQQEETQTLRNVGEGIVVESTVTTITTYTRHYQKQFAESDKVDKVSEKKGVSVAEVLEKLDGSLAEEPKESAAMKGEDKNSTVDDQQELDVEPLTKEIEKDQQEGSELKESVSVLSDTTDDVDTEGTEIEQGKHEPEQGVEEDVAPDVDDEEIPPVVQRKSLRVRYKVVSKAVSTKGHKGGNATEPNVETEYSDINEKVVEQKKKHPLLDENIPIDSDKEQQDQTLEKINVDQECVPSAEEATGSITTVTEVCTEECKVVLQHAKPDTVSLLEDGADDVAQESPAVTADPVTEELQGSTDTVCEVSKLHQATVVLIDFKLAGPKFAENNTVETPAQEECPTLDKDQVILIASEEEQGLKPDVMVVVEEQDEGKMANSEEISTDVATEGDTDDKDCNAEDTADTEKSGDGEVSFVDTRLLRSGRKMVKVNKVIEESEKNDTGNFNAEDTSAVPVEEEDVCELLEADSTVADVKGNLSPTETDEESSQEQSQVSTKTLRGKTKSITVTPAHRTTRRQVHKRGESDKEEPMTKTITLRSKRNIYTGSPGQMRKQNQNKQVKVSNLPETENKSEIMGEAQHVNLESEEKIEQPDDRCDVASEGEAADETADIEKDKEQQEKACEEEQKETSNGEHSGEKTTTDEGIAVNDKAPSDAQTKEDKHQEIQDLMSAADPVVGPDNACTENLKKDEDQEVAGVDGQNTTEEQPEGLSETEANTPLEEGKVENAVRIDEENEHTPIIITRSLRSGTKTTSISPSSKFRRENLKEKVEPPTESFGGQNVASTVEEAPELEKNIKEGEIEAVAGVQIQAQADIAGSIHERCSGEDPSENMLPPLSDAQNINYALVDLKSTSHDTQDAEESSSETVLLTNDDKANKNDIVEKVDIPGPGSVVSDLDDQQCTSEITAELLQEDAVEEGGRECEAVRETEGNENEEQKRVVLPEEQCSSSVDSVPEEDTKVLVQQDEEGLVRVEITPVENLEVLRSGDSIVTTTEEGKAMEIDEDEGTAGEESAKDELTAGTRKRRRSATTTPPWKSKRVSRQSKKEEKEDSTSAEESQEEDPKAELEDIKEESGGEKTKESVENKAEVLKEDSSGIEEHQEQEKEVCEDRNTINEQTVETRAQRKRRSAAGATPQQASKRVCPELKEAPKITVESSEPEDKSIIAEAITEESPIVPLMAQEIQPVLPVTSEDEQKETSDGEHSGEETATDEGKAWNDKAPSGAQTKDDKQQGDEDVMSTTDPDVGPDSVCTEEESEVTEDQVPTRTSRSLRSKTKTSQAKPSHNPSKVEEQEEAQLKEDLAEAIQLDGVEEAKDVPLESLAGDDSEDQAEETVDQTGKTTADIAENPEENLESEEATSGSVEEDEDDDEWSLSEEEAIVIGSRVLRGRTVPSFVITPQSTPRLRRAKVQMSEENHTPVHKRKNAEPTSTSELKRRGRV